MIAETSGKGIATATATATETEIGTVIETGTGTGAGTGTGIRIETETETEIESAKGTERKTGTEIVIETETETAKEIVIGMTATETGTNENVKERGIGTETAILTVTEIGIENENAREIGIERGTVIGIETGIEIGIIGVEIGQDLVAEVRGDDLLSSLRLRNFTYKEPGRLLLLMELSDECRLTNNLRYPWCGRSTTGIFFEFCIFK